MINIRSIAAGAAIFGLLATSAAFAEEPTREEAVAGCIKISAMAAQATGVEATDEALQAYCDCSVDKIAADEALIAELRSYEGMDQADVTPSEGLQAVDAACREAAAG